MKLQVRAAAKLNLYLDILARLDNGYHSLCMLMQSVALYDTVTVEQTEGQEITLTCSEPSLPTDGKNIACKAAKIFMEATGVQGGVRMHIDKAIPFAAGLAGGSADGAAVLYALNELFETNLDEAALCRLGARVGADVPFCLTGGTRLAQNIGDVLSPLPDFSPNYTFVLVKPDCSVSTAQAYGAYDNCHSIRHPDGVKMLAAAAQGDWQGVFLYAGNVFEQFVEVGDRVPIKAIMRRHNASLCQMSGSGPTVFGVFEHKVDAELCAQALRQDYKNVYVCAPAQQGLEIVKEASPCVE